MGHVASYRGRRHQGEYQAVSAHFGWDEWHAGP